MRPDPDEVGSGEAEPDGEHPDQAGPHEEAEQRPLLTLAEGLPEVTDTPAGLVEACARLTTGSGPVAIDAERASGYRYSGRAYLVQLRRAGSGTILVDPVAYESLALLQEALAGTEWILHAATQDLPCLTELGLVPSELFDTELAGRLLGYPRVGLATLVEDLLGYRLKKEHSAADWSRRPLPQSWLEYAALDVEVLIELRDRLAAELEAAGKWDWARQEFDHLRGFEASERHEAWRRTSGMHKARGRRALAAVRALWEVRDEIAERRDVTPGRVLPDRAIVAAATALPTDRASLLGTKGFHGRGAERYANRWLEALRHVAALGEDELPERSPRTDGPPVARSWGERDPEAARRLELAREAMTGLSERHQMPVENLLTPDVLRRTLWAPPRTRDPGPLLDAVVSQLSGLGARGWQIALAAPVVVTAVLRAAAEARAGASGVVQEDAGDGADQAVPGQPQAQDPSDSSSESSSGDGDPEP